MLRKWESFPDESIKLSRAAGIEQQHMQRTFIELGHAISVPVFYKSLFLNVFY
jgi:hypothetical protein